MNIAATVPSMVCNVLPALKGYLASIQHNLESRPNGQLKYTFPDGLILNVYETTGSVVFQGAGAGGSLAHQIAAVINQLNVSVPV